MSFKNRSHLLCLSLAPLIALFFVSCKGAEAPASASPAIPPEPSAVPASCAPKPGPDPVLAAPSASILFGANQTLSVTSGTAPFTFSVESGPARVDSTSGLFTGAGSGTTVVKVSDSNCRSATTTIAVGAPPSGVSPDDTYYVANSLWHLTKMDLFNAWGINHDADSLIVGVIDTGIDYTHPDLVDNILPAHGKNFVVNPGDPLENDPKDDNFHGTHVAGTLAAKGNNAMGTVGIAWKAKLLALKFLDQDGSGFTSDAIRAIDYAQTQGVKVLSNSWGGGGFSQSLKDAVDRAAASGILFVVAAGNDGIDIDATPQYPASFASSNLVAVASSDTTDHLSWFSNFGVNSVPIAAPGSSIKSTFPTYMTAVMTSRSYPMNYHSISGTSMAAPQVSGLAALLWSYDSTLSLSDLKARISVGVDKLSALSGKVSSGGRSNAARVMNPGH